ELPIEPVWVCPLRLRESAPARGLGSESDRPWPLYPLEPDTTYVNIGFWSSAPIEDGMAEGAWNRLIETEGSRLGGHQSLDRGGVRGRGGGAPAHRDRGLPARRAQVPVLGGLLLTRGVRAALRWRARGTAQGRVRPRRAVRDTVREGGWRTMTMTIGEMIEAFATGEPPLRITAYDGSAVGPADSPLELRLKSEK